MDEHQIRLASHAGVLAHGSPAEAQVVLDHGPKAFHDLLAEVSTHAHAQGLLDPAHEAHHNLLTHPDATHQDQKNAVQSGSGFGNFLKGLFSAPFKLIGGVLGG